MSTAPESRVGGGFVVAMFFEAHTKDIIGKFSILGKAVDSFTDIKIYPTITEVFGEILFLNEILGNVG